MKFFRNPSSRSFPVDHPFIKWFLVGVAVLSIGLGVVQWQGNRLLSSWEEMDEAWLVQDEQWNADIAEMHSRILGILESGCYTQNAP